MANFELNVKVNGVEQSVSTIGGLEQALAATNAQLTQVEENSKEFTFLKNQAQNLEKVLGALTSDAKSFDQSLKGVNSSAKNLNTTFSQTAQAANNLDDAGKAAKNTSNTIKEATGSAASLRLELRQIVQELQTLEPGSARFQELSVRAGELRDQIADTNSVVNQLAGNFTERLARGIQNTVSIGVAGFQAITAAQALFGTESEAINQTILKLTALLNLSQALETLGGLGDKITEIKAAFSSLFPAVQQTTSAVTATTVATTAEATATVGATTATSAWAVALNALPLVAIVTAVGLLVAGLIEYASGSDEAAKAEEERKKKLEEQKAAIDAVVEAQAKEGAGLSILLNRLKQSAPASKERADLLKQINSEYTTNLQNLKDEEAFQKQVTKATESYITQLKNKIALKIVDDQYTETFRRQLEVRRLLNEAENKSTVNTLLLNAATGALNSKLEINNFLGVNLGETLAANQNLTFNLIKTDQARASSAVKLSAEQIATLKAEDKQLQENLDNLGQSIGEYEALLTGAFEKRDKNTKQTNSNLEEQKRLEEEALQKAKEFAEQANQAEVDLARSRVQRTVDRIDDIEFEKDVKLAQIIVEYETAKKSIEDNIKDEKDRAATLKLLEANFQRQVTAQKLLASEKEDEIRKESLKKQKEFLEELVLAQDILTKEITFGNNNAADSLDALEQRRKKIEIDRLTREIESNTLSLDDYEAKQKKRQELLLDYNEKEFAINSKQAITERDFQISEIVKFYKEQEKFNIEFNQATGQYTVTATKEYLDEVKKLNDGSDAKAIETAENVQNVINQSAVNLNKEATVKIEEADANYQNKRVDNDKKANDEILANRLKLGEDLLQIFSQFNDAAAEIESLRVQQENQAQVARNEQAAAAAQAQVDALEAAYAQDIENNAYTEEQKQQKRKETDNLIKGLVESSNKAIDKSNRDLAEKQFKRQKALNITTALINGAQAVLQAIAQFGPPPSPLGIAGIVAAGIITAAQVAAIAAQKFDGGASGAPTSVSTPPLSDVSTPTATTGQSLQQLTGGFTAFTDQATGGGAGTAPSTGSATFTSAQKVYVLESDITAAQDRVRVLENNSTFG